MQNFVLAGKAKTVFRTIELKAKLETMKARAMANLKAKEFTCEVDNITKCTKPKEQSCLNSRCLIWNENMERMG